MVRKLTILFFTLVVFFRTSLLLADISVHRKDAHVFFNEACGMCAKYLKTKLSSLLRAHQIELNYLDYINNRDNRKLLHKMNSQWNIPFELQSHMETFISDKLVLAGHIPEQIVVYLLEHGDEYDKILVFQDKMHGDIAEYKVWDFVGEIKTYAIDEPITTYLAWIKRHKKQSKFLPQSKGFWGLFGVVTTSAFLDGINPCAFAILLFFISFLFSIRKTKASIWKMGLVYVAAIYLAYFSIGIGIAQAFIISGSPHLMAYIGAYLVMGLGIIQMLGVVFPGFPIKLRVPTNTKPTIEKWLFKATLPAAFVGGFLVGLCTFPCSGGIYVAIIGLLAAKQTYVHGLAWMVWYNLVFVSPLFVPLTLAGNPKTTEKLHQWERSHSQMGKSIVGVTMIALGLIMVMFFV